MVSTAVLLITVSSLVAHISAIPTKNLVNRDPCEGRTHCYEKPADYPQEAIDDIITRYNLTQIHRMKRQTSNIDMNECVKKRSITEGPLFQVTSGGRSLHVVQSKVFEQTVTRVECRTDSACFKFSRNECHCQPLKTTVKLLTLDKGASEPQWDKTDLTTGCQCVEKRK